jgi:RNA-binding protein 39
MNIFRHFKAFLGLILMIRFTFELYLRINFMNLYFSNLHFSVNEAELLQLLEAYAPIESINIIKDRKSGKSKGYAFITFTDAAKAKLAMQTLNGKVIRERELKIKLADKQ